MTQDLQEHLDDLVTGVPTYVVPDARAAWTAGARRRTRRRIAVGAAAIAVLAVLAGVVSWLPHTLDPAPADPDGAGVDGYPARVDQPWSVRELPSAPGPMAIVFEQSDGSWWLASADGRSWPVPQHGVIDSYPPALSPDGRMLGYLADRRMFVLQDLVTGKQTEFSDIGDGGGGLPAPRWFLGSQGPAFWSPDGTRLLVRVGGLEPGTEATTALVLGVDGSQTELVNDDYPAGWLDNDTTAWLAAPDHGHQVRLAGQDREGRVISTVTLDLHSAQAAYLSQWSASVSPDGSRVVIVDAQGTALLYRLADGKLIRYAPIAASDTCSASWWSNRPVVYAADQLQTLGSGAVTTFDIGDETTCAMAPAGALNGRRHPGLGWSEQFRDWAPFHMMQLLLSAGLVLGVVALFSLRLRRRPLEPTS